MLRSLTLIERRIAWVGLITVLIVMLVTLAAINRFRLFRAETDLRLLQDRFADYRVTQDSREKALRAELEEIERTLYAPIDAPPPPQRRAAAAETWMLNQTADLKKRIKVLEDWRYRIDGVRP